MEQLKRKFIWNEHGVCTNPEKIRVHNAKAYAGIDLAEYNGRWYVGFDYHLFKSVETEDEYEGICGGAGLPGLNDKAFATKEAAKLYAYKSLLKQVSHKPTLLKLVKENKHKFLQLSLFDNA